MKLLVVYYSMYGHIYQMANAEAEGASEVAGTEVVLKQVPETLSDDILLKLGALEARKYFKQNDVATVNELADYDAIIFGFPTRFGNVCGQMRSFLDGAGGLWTNHSLVGKVSGIFTSTATQHGGQESTILSFMPTLFHLGLIVTGLPYTFENQMRIDEISGNSPYGASTITGGKGERMPSENELAAARFQGKHIATIASKLCK